MKPDSPYKGLAAFDESDLDALLFFGRESDTHVIAANLLASRFTVLYGPTGVGKSSVLRAGVVHRVRSLAPDALVVVHDTWAGDRDLASGVLAALPGAEAPSSDASLADRLAELLAGHGGHLYLILDQFEEAFAYRGASALAAELAEVVTRPKLRVNVLVALREDALAELDVFTGLVANVFGNYLALDRLDRTAGHAAIVGPLERYNELSDRPVEAEPELVDAVLDEVEVGRVVPTGVARGGSEMHGDGGIEAPYLQLVMQRLWEVEHDMGSAVLRRATLHDLGGAEEIVRAHLERALGGLARREQDVAARVFNQLVTPSGTKVAHSIGDLAQYARVREGDLRPVLASLGADRIVRPLDGRFEIFHDVLADAVLAWRTRHEAERAAEAERERVEQRNRRLVALLIASLVGLAAMAAVTVYALTQRADARDRARVARAEARRAEASKLASIASALIPVAPVQIDPELGLLLAGEAARLSASERIADILRRALLVSHLRRVLPQRRVVSASFGPGSIVAGGADGVARVYAADGRRRLATLRGDRALTGVAASPDGRLVLTTESGGPATIWDVESGESVHSLGRSPHAASFSPDGTLVLTIEPSGVSVWRVADGSSVATLSQQDPVRAASFAPDGRLVATVGSRRLARVFDVTSGRLVASVDQGGDVTSASIAPGGRRLVTTGRNGTARVWTLPGGRRVHELKGHRGQITAGVLSPEGKRLVTTSTDGTARVWDIGSGLLITDVGGHTNHVTGAEWSRDGLSVVTWSSDGTARVWRPGTGSTRVVLAGPGDVVTQASFDRSGERVLTTSADGRVRIWRSRVDAELRTIARVPTPITAASLSLDGSVVAVAGEFGLWILRSVDGRRLAALPARDVTALAVDRSGALVAVARGPRIETIRVESGETVGTIEVGGKTTALAFGPDAGRLAVGTNDGAIGIWTPDGRRLISLLSPRRVVVSVAFSPDGDRVAAGLGNGAMALWSLQGGQRRYQRLGHRPGSDVLSVEFSPDGRRIATSARDSTVRVWRAATGAPSFLLRGHFALVSDASFSPDARWLVTAGPSTAGLWDLASRQRLLFLEGHSGPVLAASFDSTGRRITTVGADGTVRSYLCAVCGGVPELLSLAERRLAATGRKLTAAERRLYVGG
jgi:WD40 repeat protein